MGLPLVHSDLHEWLEPSRDERALPWLGFDQAAPHKPVDRVPDGVPRGAEEDEESTYA
jgi:hypothetical protein